MATAAWKRRISQLEEEVEALQTSQQKKLGFAVAGHCIRRLVSLTARVEDLTGLLVQGIQQTAQSLTLPKEGVGVQGCTQTCKHLQGGDTVFKISLNKGADSARGDDAASLKSVVVQWLMSADPEEPALRPDENDGRGFDHELTGHLLCLVDYDWWRADHHAAIHDCHPDFLVTTYSWPTFLYENELFDPNNPADGLFNGKLLVEAFKQIFTSPTLVLKMDDEPSPRKCQRRDKRCTHSHVASLLGMKSVCPHAVAYAAVQVVDGEFNYEDFYNNIIDFFEDAETPDDKNTI
ncbi:hypothetical protein EDD16DRAFT_1516808 [Pisolithus croceorrhizus]|nr:hypothetical protein EDD16DRAFT_1516808 [Pisolithus croceorrhizus]